MRLLAAASVGAFRQRGKGLHRVQTLDDVVHAIQVRR